MNAQEARRALRDSVAATQQEVRSWLHKRHDLDAYALHSAGSLHPGDPASVIDGIAVRRLHSECIDRFGDIIHFVGEESLTTAAIAPGHFALQDDAVDGTLPAKALGLGHATTGVLYHHEGNGHFVKVAAAVATESSVVTWEDRQDATGRLYVSDPVDPNDETQLDAVHPGDPNLVSVVAAKPGDRRDAQSLLDTDCDLTVFNLGGSPMLFPLLNLELGAVVSFHRQTPWDAMDVLAIEALEEPGTVITASGVMSRSDVMTWLDKSMAGPNPKSVPPHATITHPDLIGVLLPVLQSTTR